MQYSAIYCLGTYVYVVKYFSFFFSVSEKPQIKGLATSGMKKELSQVRGLRGHLSVVFNL